MTVTTDTLIDEILTGLKSNDPHLPCRLLYDEKGSQLFDQICLLPEYYPTRTEMSILRDSMSQLRQAIGPAVEVIEFGSGSGEKTALILDGLDRPDGLHLVEISAAALAGSIERLQAEFPDIAVHGQNSDYTQPLLWPQLPTSASRRLLFFPGSTIGNFTKEDAKSFLKRLRQPSQVGDLLLLGTDMVKDIPTLLAAYDDRQGVTAAFNRNILSHCNDLFDADFEPNAFNHEARYDNERQRISMHLIAANDQDVIFAGESLHFQSGDEIRTEYSHKFTPEGVRILAEAAGWQPVQSWYDDRQWFGVHLFQAG